MLRRFHEIVKKREDGFTLIELLVVMIIIGILAAVAIPIFLNQQKTARDTATTSDVKNLATNVQSALVRYPDATYFAVTDTTPGATGPTAATSAAPSSATDTNGDGKIFVVVGNSATAYESVAVSVTGGTNLSIAPGTGGGDYVIKGWNTNGKVYLAAASGRTYNSAAGGLS